MTIGELFIELGFKADTMKLNDFMKSVAQLNMASIASALGLGVMYEATAKIMNMADAAAMSMFGFGESTGMSARQMQQFSNVSEQLGANAGDAQASLKNLQMAMINVKLGRGNIEPFILAGIDPTKERDVFSVLEKIQRFVNDPNIDAGIKRMVVAEFGLSESMIQVLKNSGDIREAMAQQRVAADEQVDTMVRFHQINSKLGQEFKLLWVDIGSLIEPIIEAIERLVSLITHLLDNILGGRKNLVASVGTFAKETINTLFPFLPKNLPEKVGDWLNPFKGKSLDDIFSIYGLLPHIPALAGEGATHITNDIKVEVSGVSDPEKASDLAVKKFSKMLTDTYYHRETQSR